MSLAENVCLCLMFVCLPVPFTQHYSDTDSAKNVTKPQVQNDLLLQRSVIILNRFRDEHPQQLILGRSLIAEGMKVIANGHYLNEQTHCTPPPASVYLYIFIYMYVELDFVLQAHVHEFQVAVGNRNVWRKPQQLVPNLV